MKLFSEITSLNEFDKIAFSISGELAFRSSNVPERASTYDRSKSYTTPEASDVRSALDRAPEDLDARDLCALLSPAADEFLEEMAESARQLTRQRFGRTIQLYAPLYLSNECHSICSYCGFSHERSIRRLTLSVEQVYDEARILYDQGIRHILLLTGEAYRKTPVGYIAECVAALRGDFPSISIEVYPLKTEEYAGLRDDGLDGVAVYQETYDPVRYREVHRAGMKSQMNYRLNCPDRAGMAGVRRIAIGALLGLSDPAADAYFVAMHARHLLKRYWRSQVSVSLPRMRTATGVQDLPDVDDRLYARLLFALRLFLPDAGLNLSTREPATFRDQMVPICITHMSAGSQTEPGGYSGQPSDAQFDVEDRRSIQDVRQMLQENNLEPLYVDWHASLK